MATLINAHKPNLARIAFHKKRDEIIGKLLPRPCMIVSVGLILAGLGIPLLMALQLLPSTLVLGFLSILITATGSVLTLVFCGEIKSE